MLTGLLVFALVVVALLAVPVSVDLDVDTAAARRQAVTLRWAFGLLTVRVPASDGRAEARRRSGRDARAARKDAARGARAGDRKTDWVVLVRQRDFRRRLLRFARDLWRAVHTEDLRLHLRVGLGDPADTGRLWAIAGPVAGMLAAVPSAVLRLEPEFLDAAFRVRGSGSLRFVPLQILGLAAALALSPAVWRGLRRARVAGAAGAR